MEKIIYYDCENVFFAKAGDPYTGDDILNFNQAQKTWVKTSIETDKDLWSNWNDQIWDKGFVIDEKQLLKKGVPLP